MNNRKILITAPSLKTANNVSGVSSVTSFIISNNKQYTYRHFELGRKDSEKRNVAWLIKLAGTNFKWAAVLLKKEIGLVHFNFAFSKASIIRDAPLVFFARLLRKKMLVHLHGGDYIYSKQPPSWMKFLLKAAFGGKTNLMVLSEGEKEAIKKYFPNTVVNVLPNCVDLKEAQAFKRTEVSAEAPVRLLFIGRIASTKGLDIVYDAIKLLKQKNINYKFIMAGAGPDEEKYKNIFSELLVEKFEFKGVVSGEAKTALFKSSQIFVLPSLFEGLPMSLLETMAFGMVPVVTNVGSISFVVKNGVNGFINALDNNIAENVAANIEKLINNKAMLNTMANAAAACIVEQYSPQEYIETLNKTYAALQ